MTMQNRDFNIVHEVVWKTHSTFNESWIVLNNGEMNHHIPRCSGERNLDEHLSP